jgi:hypothetical protein
VAGSAGNSEKNEIFLVVPVDEDMTRRRKDIGVPPYGKETVF